MIDDGIVYKSLVQALSVLGKENVELVMMTLKEQKAVEGDKVNLKRLEPALKAIFGDGAKVLLEPAIRSTSL